MLLSACAGLHVEKTPLQTPLGANKDATPLPIGFNKIAFAIPTGTPMIAANAEGWLGPVLCKPPYGIVTQTSLRKKSATDDTMRGIFNTTMQGLGYDVTGDPGRMFDTDADDQRTMLAIGGRITDIKINFCRKVNFWGRAQGITGEANIEIEWTVFDLINRRNVFKTSVRGYGRLESPNPEGVEILFEKALSAAAHNLGANPDFYNLVFFGDLPTNLPGTHTDPYENAASLFDPAQPITLAAMTPSTTPAAGRWGEIKTNAVLLQKIAHGSGFFITSQGHILTNAHVVGNASRMRVVTSGKEHKLTAEVLRVDKMRDVALLKLESIPDTMVINPLPIVTNKAIIGQDVYLIGAPAYTRLQDTLTKGIVSAHRVNPYTKLPFIQADITVHGGNSGGPVLDEYGNIIGLSVSGYIDNNGPLSGLNSFIPIASALESLGITLDARTKTMPVELAK